MYWYLYCEIYLNWIKLFWPLRALPPRFFLFYFGHCWIPFFEEFHLFRGESSWIISPEVENLFTVEAEKIRTSFFWIDSVCKPDWIWFIVFVEIVSVFLYVNFIRFFKNIHAFIISHNRRNRKASRSEDGFSNPSVCEAVANFWKLSERRFGR